MIKRGVRGSPLGPLLFIIYRNDLSAQINALSELVIFIDDTGIISMNIDFPLGHRCLI